VQTLAIEGKLSLDMLEMEIHYKMMGMGDTEG